MKALALLLLCASALCAQSGPLQPSAKEALLIANGDYVHFGKLPNPVSDARLLAQSLKKVGFEVTLVENQSREGMLDALNAFQDRLKATRGIALFHYGGHGVQVSGRNFLIPVDADIPDERKVSTRAVDMEEVMTTLDASGSQVNVVVLDACRDNPLPATSSRSASRGLSVVQTKPKNSLIVYAAEPGSKAEDGLFTPTLADAITSPGKSLSQIFKDVRRQVFQKSNGNQTPGEYDQLFEDVYLAGGGSALPPPPQQILQSPPTPQPSINPMMAVAPRSSSGGFVASVDRPNLGPQFVNTLGQRFVPIPGTPTYFCIWSTRVSDYGQFVRETGRFWKPAGFPQKPDHAAVRISWEDATAFCEWLTQKEHATGKLPANLEYRLPKDLEWSTAAGITAKEMDGPPAWRSGGVPNCYAWGGPWPPPPGVGNIDPKMKTDPYLYTSPVGSFAPNRLGLYDMCGNVLQWCQEDFDESGQGFLRGSSWPDEEPDAFNLTARHNNLKSTAYKCYGFRCVIAPIAQNK